MTSLSSNLKYVRARIRNKFELIIYLLRYKVDNARGRQSETRRPPARGEYADRGRIIITTVVP
jgi:hypothetical protein